MKYGTKIAPLPWLNLNLAPWLAVDLNPECASGCFGALLKTGDLWLIRRDSVYESMCSWGWGHVYWTLGSFITLFIQDRLVAMKIIPTSQWLTQWRFIFPWVVVQGVGMICWGQWWGPPHHALKASEFPIRRMRRENKEAEGKVFAQSCVDKYTYILIMLARLHLESPLKLKEVWNCCLHLGPDGGKHGSVSVWPSLPWSLTLTSRTYFD